MRFHSPTGLSASSLGNCSCFLLFHRAPEPLSAPLLVRFAIARVPNLHLRHAAQIDAAVALRADLPIDPHLEIAILASSSRGTALCRRSPARHSRRASARRCRASSWRRARPVRPAFMAAISRGSRVAPPVQSSKSRPLNSAVNPAGGWLFSCDCASEDIVASPSNHTASRSLRRMLYLQPKMCSPKQIDDATILPNYNGAAQYAAY